MILYHGTDHIIEKFSMDYTGEGNDQYGPGVYLTNSIKLASGYGKQLYELDIIKSRLRNGDSKLKPNRHWLFAKAKHSTDWESTAQNWDEDPKIGLRIACEGMVGEYSDTYGECIQQLWIEFFRQEEPLFCREMSASRIDGIIYKIPQQDKNEKVIFVTLFNPDAIRSVKRLK